MAGRIMELALQIRGQLDGSVGSSMRAAAREASNLRSQISNVNREMREAQRAASAEMRGTGAVREASYARIAALQARINAMTERRGQLLSAQAAKEKADAAFSNARSRLGGAAQTTAIAALPVAGMVATAANFEAAMSKVKAITNSSNDDMERLSATAQKLGATTQFSATQAAEAMTYLGMAGWKTDQIIAGMPGLLDLAAASGEDLARVSDIVSDDLTAFGMSADQASHMADVMAATSTNANTNVSMMGETFKYVGSLAGALGYSLEDVSVATGIMANAHIKGEQAGTSLRAIMTRLVDPPKEAGMAMERLGISVTNADGTMKPFMQTMLELRQKFAGMSEAEKAETASSIAGQEAMSGFLAIVNASDSDFDTLVNAVNNADGAAARMAGTMQDNAKGGAIQLKSAIEGLSISVGQIFLPYLAAAASGLASAVGGVASWAQAHQTLTAAALGVAAAIAGIVIAGLALNAVITAFEAFRSTMALLQMTTEAGMQATLLQSVALKAQAAAARIAAAAQAAFNAVMSANPIALVVLAVVALVAALVYLYNNNETVRSAIISAWNSIKSAAVAVWNSIAPTISAAWEAIKAAAQAGITFLQGIWTTIQPYVSAFGSFLISALSGLIGVIGTVLSVAVTIVGGILQGIIAIFGAVFSVVVTVVSVAFTVISAVISAAITVISAIISVLAPIFSAVWTVITVAAKVAFIVISTVIFAAIAVIGGILQVLVAIATAVWNAIVMAAQAAWALLAPIVMPVIEAIIAGIEVIMSVAEAVWAAISAAAMAAWTEILAIVMPVIDEITYYVDAAEAMISAAWDAISSAASAAWNMIVSTVQSVIDTVMSTIDEGVAYVTEKWEHLKSIFSSPINAVVNFIKGGDSSAATAADVSENAKGGIYEKGAFLTTFAEDSAEAAIPLDGSQRAISLWMQAGERLGTLPQIANRKNVAPQMQAATQAAAPAVAMQNTVIEATAPQVSEQTTQVVAAPPVNNAPVSLSFSPSITVEGNADPGVAAAIQQQLEKAKREFESQLPQMMQRVQARQRRLAYD